MTSLFDSNYQRIGNDLLQNPENKTLPQILNLTGDRNADDNPPPETVAQWLKRALEYLAPNLNCAVSVKGDIWTIENAGEPSWEFQCDDFFSNVCALGDRLRQSLKGVWTIKSLGVPATAYVIKRYPAHEFDLATGGGWDEWLIKCLPLILPENIKYKTKYIRDKLHISSSKYSEDFTSEKVLEELQFLASKLEGILGSKWTYETMKIQYIAPTHIFSRMPDPETGNQWQECFRQWLVEDCKNTTFTCKTEIRGEQLWIVGDKDHPCQEFASEEFWTYLSDAINYIRNRESCGFKLRQIKQNNDAVVAYIIQRDPSLNVPFVAFDDVVVGYTFIDLPVFEPPYGLPTVYEY